MYRTYSLASRERTQLMIHSKKYSFVRRCTALAGAAAVATLAIGAPAWAAPGDVSTLAGSGSAGSVNATGAAASFNSPYGVAVDGAGNVYVADRGNHLIRRMSSAGVVSTLAGSGSVGSVDGTGAGASFNSHYEVAVDGAGNVYVGDGGNHLIRKVSSAGVVSTLAGSGSAG